MGAGQRTKGAGYEREIARQFTDAIELPDLAFKRNIGQARDGGHDIDVGPLVVEAKRRKTLLTLDGWMEQADAAARQRAKTQEERAAHIPTVVARADEGESYIVFRLADFLEHFSEPLRDMLIGDPYHRGS